MHSIKRQARKEGWHGTPDISLRKNTKQTWKFPRSHIRPMELEQEDIEAGTGTVQMCCYVPEGNEDDVLASEPEVQPKVGKEPNSSRTSSVQLMSIRKPKPCR